MICNFLTNMVINEIYYDADQNILTFCLGWFLQNYDTRYFFYIFSLSLQKTVASVNHRLISCALNLIVVLKKNV